MAEAGGSLINKRGNRLDRVLYISGKATLLDPNTGKIQNTSERDFENADDLYRAILLLSNWTSADEIERYKPDELLDALDELFELESQLIVVDDIDTLTTSKKDAGMEELLLALSRSRSGTKVLYTQRGFPSFAPNASVEVPGLTDEEFQEFVLLCCSKFNVPLPTIEDFEHIKLHSERRPLAIETMMGMRRVTSSYADAFRRWKENSSEARQYLFNREYQQLGTDDRARHLLAALAIFDGPQSAETLRSVLQFSPEQLEDAIAETRDMFLAVAPGDGSRGDLFSLGAATRLYLRETSKQLDRYSSIEARVRHFQNSSKTTPDSFIPIIERASRNLRAGHPNDAIALLSNKDLPAAFKEHTEVQALLGQAYATLNPPNVADARRCFESAFSLGHRHYKMYLEWLEMERKNRTEVSNGIAICSKVIRSSGFNLKTKAAFQKKMAMYKAMKANDIEMTSPLESAILRKESAINTLEAYFIVKNARDKELPAYKERAETTLSSMLRRLSKGDDIDGFFDFIESLLSLKQPLDDFQMIISSRIGEFRPHEPGSKRPMQARLSRLNGKINHASSSAFSRDNLKILSDRIKSTIQVL
ncbi:MAG: hypothetical protein E5Y89_00465 [Mesorhizobium sp.]|nr:MAG: hypothetical protein E5Y89_00465 [Mesorhizobium sp.]